MDLVLAYQGLFAFVGINSLLALSIYATLSCGQLSLANAGFMAIGAYTGAVITLHSPGVPFVIVLLASAAVPAAVAVPLGLPVLRLRGVFLAIATIGFGEVVRLVFVNWDYTNGALGLVAIPQRTSLWTIWLALAGALFLLGRLRGSRAGYALEAIREDETAARTMGIETTAYKLAMFSLGAALAGLAGGLEAHYTFMVAPGGYGFGRVVDMLVFAVVGGAAAFFGPVIGAAFLTVLPELLREVGARLGLQPGPFRLFLNGAILLAVILYLPNGLASLPRRLHWRRKLKDAQSAARPGVRPQGEEARRARSPRGTAGSRQSLTLSLSGVSRVFGGVRAVDDASFEVKPGEVHGLIGPNGAGKTTLLNLISGLLLPSGGTIQFEGRRIDRLPPQRIAALGVARTYQNIRLFAGLSAEDNAIVGQHLRRRAPFWRRLLLLPSARREEQRAREAALAGLERVGMKDRARAPAYSLSYGEQRRIEIARALAAGPRLILLDEPTAGMNPPEAAAVAKLVREVAREGRAVLLIEHNVRLVMELCDRITVLNFGKVIARGAPAEIAKDPAVIAAYLGEGP